MKNSKPSQKSSKRSLQKNQLDYKSIAHWFAIGFFLGDKNFTNSRFTSIAQFGPNIDWHYSPKRNISFSDVLDNFSSIIESLLKRNLGSRKIILPLSGGLDTRTLAAALFGNKNIVTFSYEFEGGINETGYARQIAEASRWEFNEYKISNGYLWRKIEELAELNYCQSDFTHPRQMAVIESISGLGDILLSGQWGDVLFDNFDIDKDANIDFQTNFVLNKIVKIGGMELANKLWECWGLAGSFEDELFELVQNLLVDIKISNPISRIRAFKSIHWAKRWANPNLNIFSKYTEMYIPFYSDEICNFICSTPEKYLKNRKVQIEYIKSKAPTLARIPWQEYDLDLYQFQYFNSIYFPRRVYRYGKRIIREKILKKPRLITRNYELQFLGKNNEKKLEKWLFNNPKISSIIPFDILSEYYGKFKNVDPVKYSHPLSMLLTFSLWCHKNNSIKD